MRDKITFHDTYRAQCHGRRFLLLKKKFMCYKRRRLWLKTHIKSEDENETRL